MKAFGFSRRSSSVTTYFIKGHQHSEDDDFILIVIAKNLRDDTRDDGARRQDQDQQEELSALHDEEPTARLHRLTLSAKKTFRALHAWRKPKDQSRPKKEASNGCAACW